MGLWKTKIPYCTVLSLMGSQGWLLKNANYLVLSHRETFVQYVTSTREKIFLKSLKNRSSRKISWINSLARAPSKLLIESIIYSLTRTYLINDLYQSIHRPRFVNHIRESKINTLNVIWTREKCSGTWMKGKLTWEQSFPHPWVLPNQIWIVENEFK